MDILNESKFRKSKKLSANPKSSFGLPIYIQRRLNIGITIICPDMNIARYLPLPENYESTADFYHDFLMSIIEVDTLSDEEFKLRDLKTNKKHRETLFPRGLKDHIKIDIHKLKFKPPIAAQLTTKSLRSWQRWCILNLKVNDEKLRTHYQIPFSALEPHLKKEFIEDPLLILSFLSN
jgi:hypothetical protein